MRLGTIVGAFALAAAATACSIAASDRSKSPAAVDVQLLALTDFHGHLEPASGSNGRIGSVDTGGVEYLASRLAALKLSNPNTLVVSGGDNIGAAPLISTMFHNEPAIEALNTAGLQVSTVGNHELDEGWQELLRMQNGGCHPVDGCQDGTPFGGARFDYVAANIAREGTSATLFPAYVVKEIGGVKIGFIGLVLEDVATVVAPASLEGLRILAEVPAANEAAADLRRQGVRAIVLLIHEGGSQPGGYDGCDHLSGPIVAIVRQLSKDIDVVVSGHRHNAYNCTIGSRLVTSASSFGRLITRIDLRIDRRTDTIVSKTAHNLLVTHDLEKNAAETALIDHYRPFALRIGERQVGSIASPVTAHAAANGESALGDVIADAMLEASQPPPNGSAVVAFINPGGIRADLAHDPVRYADAFEILPFANIVTVKTMTGDALARLLEQQFDAGGSTILQVSRGFAYAYDLSRPRGRRVDLASITIGGQTISPGGRYRVAAPDFLWSGGDGFTAFTEGTDPTAVGRDLDLFIRYLETHAPIGPTPANRIRKRSGARSDLR